MSVKLSKEDKKNNVSTDTSYGFPLLTDVYRPSGLERYLTSCKQRTYVRMFGSLQAPQCYSCATFIFPMHEMKGHTLGALFIMFTSCCFGLDWFLLIQNYDRSTK